MGNSHSQGSVLSSGAAKPVLQGGTNHSVLPVDDPVYPGPKLEYRIAIVNASMKAKFTMGFRQGQELVATDVQNHYNALVKQYAEYYRLFTFFQVPMQKSAGFRSAHVPFQAIFCRPSIYVPSPESWALQIQTVQIQFSLFASGCLFTYGHSVGLPANVQAIYDMITAMAQKGGRLICIECNGNVFSSGAAFGGLIYGVDVFFDVPQHPNPKLYTYTAHSTPIVIAGSYGAVQVQCDWTGTLNMYLQQGWKLVDVLIPNLESGEMERQQNSSHGRAHYMGTRTEQTIWFFEKEVSMVNDRTPKYQVTLVEYYVHASVGGFTSIRTDFDLAGVLTEMGQRGWELCSVLDTPQTVQSGFGSATRGIILFFQRPLLGSIGGNLFIQPSNPVAAGSAVPQGPPQFGPQGMMGAQPNAMPPSGPPPGYQAPPPGYQHPPSNPDGKQGLVPPYAPPTGRTSPQTLQQQAQGGRASPQPPYPPPS